MKKKIKPGCCPIASLAGQSQCLGSAFKGQGRSPAERPETERPIGEHPR